MTTISTIFKIPVPNKMTIQEDSGEILLFIYNSYVNNKAKPNAQTLLDETKWDGKRIDRAIKYLDGIAAIEVIFTADNRMYGGLTRFILKKITPLGINIVENKPEFKRNFGFEVDLGLLKFSWGATEK